MISFNIGDRVIVIREVRHTSCAEKKLKGKIGTVVCNAITTDDMLGVEFDDNIIGHNCDGRAKQYHGYYIFPIDLLLALISPVEPVDTAQINLARLNRTPSDIDAIAEISGIS